MAAPRTRFAPSPTGDLHLGGAWTALASWALARAGAGQVILRIEDIDTPRVVSGAEARILEDLAWLGLDWDEGPIAQSARTALFRDALGRLEAGGQPYPCDCSRAEIARAASAPHAGEESVYPGTCRDKDPARAFRRSPSIRLRVPEEVVALDDGVMGPFAQDLARDVGDFVLWRGDGLVAYQLAVVVDDSEMRITDVVRGQDLLASTPRQIHLMRLLGAASPPRFWHVPLVVAEGGARLAKRTPGAAVRALREAGFSREEILGEMACGLGLTASPAPRSADDLAALARSREVRWSREPWRIPPLFAAAG